jgi:hypothetical protein
VLFGVLVLGVSSAGATTRRGVFDPAALVLSGGKRVEVGGFTPACTRGQHISLAVRITQRGRAVSGIWAQRACTGKPLRWLAILTGRRALRLGRATATASARISRHRMAVDVKRWRTGLKLVRHVRLLGDYRVTGTAVFSRFAPYVYVSIGLASRESRECAKDETGRAEDVRDGGQMDFGFTAIDSGLQCSLFPSWVDFKFVVSNVDRHADHVIATGTVFLGQLAPGTGYIASCWSGTPFEVATKRNYDWSGRGSRVTCRETGTRQVTISDGAATAGARRPGRHRQPR